MKKDTSKFFILLLLVTGSIFSQNLSNKIDQQLVKLLEQDKLTEQDTNWELSSENVSSSSGVHHIYYSQMINDIEVFGTQSSVHVLNNGLVLSASNNFVFKTVDKLSSSLNSNLSANQAVQAAAEQLNYSITDAISVLQYYGGASQRQILSNGGISLSPIPAKLMYQLVDDNFKLVWDISIQEKSQKDWWNIRVDASTGIIIDKNNYMLSCGFDHEHNNVLNYNKNLFDVSNYNKS